MSEEREWVRTIQTKGEFEEPNSETWVISIDFPSSFNDHQSFVEVSSVSYNDIGERTIKYMEIPLSVWKEMNGFVEKERAFEKKIVL